MATASKPRQLTIGTLCGMLKDEFPDISISKIRYLEDQGLLAPRRTQGGYRLFSEEDVERLETILRLQRDEFLPLRVIRHDLAVIRELPLDQAAHELDVVNPEHHLVLVQIHLHVPASLA